MPPDPDVVEVVPVAADWQKCPRLQRQGLLLVALVFRDGPDFFEALVMGIALFRLTLELVFRKFLEEFGLGELGQEFRRDLRHDGRNAIRSA